MQKYTDRRDSGQKLVPYLSDYFQDPQTLVLALPRGGVPVAYEIAKALSLPLDVFLVRKLGLPGQEELAMGAIAANDCLSFNEELLAQIHPSEKAIAAVLAAEKKELMRREKHYRGQRPFPALANKTIILVDDGMATGASMQVAVIALRKYKPAAIIIAVPVAAYSTCQELEPLVDRLICPLKPSHFYAVGCWYAHFPQISDEEVITLLEKSRK